MDLASCSLCIGKVLDVDKSTARIRFTLLTDEEHYTSKFANRLWEDNNNSFKEPLIDDFVWILENKNANAFWYTSYPCHTKDDELYKLWNDRNGILDVLLIRQNNNSNIKVYCDDDAFNIIFTNKDNALIENHFTHDAWNVLFEDSKIEVHKDNIKSSVGEQQIYLDKDKAIVYSDKDKAVIWSATDEYLKRLETLFDNLKNAAMGSPYTIALGNALNVDIPKLKQQHPKIESQKVYLE